MQISRVDSLHVRLTIDNDELLALNNALQMVEVEDLDDPELVQVMSEELDHLVETEYSDSDV